MSDAIDTWEHEDVQTLRSGHEGAGRGEGTWKRGNIKMWEKFGNMKILGN